MSPSEHKCPLCGHEFDRTGEKCRACPMSAGCGVICCPKCGYGFADRSRLVSWLKKLLGRARRSRKTTSGGDSQGGRQ